MALDRARVFLIPCGDVSTVLEEPLDEVLREALSAFRLADAAIFFFERLSAILYVYNYTILRLCSDNCPSVCC